MKSQPLSPQSPSRIIFSDLRGEYGILQGEYTGLRGEFQNIAEELLGEFWPFVFSTVTSYVGLDGCYHI